MILFMGFDGVLHPEPCIKAENIFCHLPLLEGLLRSLPDIAIVISSCWRETGNLTDLRALFSPDIAGRIIGVTPEWHECAPSFRQSGFRRQAEVESWLCQMGLSWAKWVALDGKPWLFEPALPNLVCCQANVGLDAATIDLLKVKLRDTTSHAE